MCPYPRPTTSTSYRSASSSDIVLALDRKHMDKQVSSLRISGIGHVFRSGRNSWKRKDEYRNYKKGDLTVNHYYLCIIWRNFFFNSQTYS